MHEDFVQWYSEGTAVRGILRTPDQGSGPFRAILQGPGWLGLMDSKLYLRYHRALTDAGFATLIFDYRGFGQSDGDRNSLSPTAQLLDLRNAVTYLTTRDDIDADAIGVFGTGGTGGGNAVLLADVDRRVKAAVSQVPVADGADWLHRMRSEHEWIDFLDSLERDARDRVLSGHGRMVNPREDIMVPTPERRSTSVKSDVDGRIPTSVPLVAAEEILAYRPIDAARRLRTPLMVIGVEHDATTPTDHAVQLYRAARGPKALILQRHTTHYAAYDQYWTQTTPRIVSWFDTYVRGTDIDYRETTA